MSPQSAAERVQRSTKKTLDFSKVEDRGPRRARVTPGDYLLELTDAWFQPHSQKPGVDTAMFEHKIIGGGDSMKDRIGIVRQGFSTHPDDIWSLARYLRHLIDKDIPKGKMPVNLEKYVGFQVGALLDDDKPYTFTGDDGEERTIVNSKITLTYPATEFSGSTREVAEPQEAAEDEAPAVAPKRQSASARNGRSQMAASEVTAAQDEVLSADNDDIAEMDFEEL